MNKLNFHIYNIGIHNTVKLIYQWEVCGGVFLI